ncbi:hypothetical protein SteCoe_17785 [Stentor coeruleus]|uniref:C3H1-type domain-containing protein n=1 Tax=Stentor coeruleus TaxID=5963 RepID=A0A1R2BY09_9CILI|nr:hypothetical protein SteCoe_17785 [Stentor coeruleus]
MQEDCKFGEHCFRPDCKYKHVVKNHKHITCIHFNTRGCLRGDHCPYSHIQKSPQKSPSSTKPENIIMQLTPVIPEDVNIPVKRKGSENIVSHESFPDDISMLLDNYDEEMDKSLKKQKVLSREEDDAARVQKIMEETEKTNMTLDVQIGLGNEEVSMLVDDISVGNKPIQTENLEVKILIPTENLEANKPIQTENLVANRLISTETIEANILDQTENKDAEIGKQGKVTGQSNEAKVEVSKEKPKKTQRVLHKKAQHEGQQKEVKEPQKGHAKVAHVISPKNPNQKDQNKGLIVLEKSGKPTKPETIEKPEKLEKKLEKKPEKLEKKPEKLEKMPEELEKMQEVENKDMAEEEKKVDKLMISSEDTGEVGKMTETVVVDEKPKTPRQKELEVGEIVTEDIDMGIVNDNKPIIQTKVPVQETNDKIINLKPSHEQSVKKIKEPVSASKKPSDIIELKPLDSKKQTAIIDPSKKLPESVVLTGIGSTEIKLPVSKSIEKTSQIPKTKSLPDTQIKPPTPSEKTANVNLPRKPSGVETTKILTIEEIRKKKEAAKKKEEEASIEVSKPNPPKEQPKPKPMPSPIIKPTENEQQKTPIRDIEIPPSPISNIEEPKIQQKKPVNQETPVSTGVINLPIKRAPEEKPKQVPIKVPKVDRQIKLLVGRDEWEPFQNALINLEFSSEKFSTQEAEEFKNLALKISTPEGISEIVFELEQKLSKFPDTPEDPEFERLTLSEKIDKLYKECLYH